jgi:hypothetical protein
MQQQLTSNPMRVALIVGLCNNKYDKTLTKTVRAFASIRSHRSLTLPVHQTMNELLQDTYAPDEFRNTIFIMKFNILYNHVS